MQRNKIFQTNNTLSYIYHLHFVAAAHINTNRIDFGPHIRVIHIQINTQLHTILTQVITQRICLRF